jgi:hypothetical protein
MRAFKKPQEKSGVDSFGITGILYFSRRILCTPRLDRLDFCHDWNSKAEPLQHLPSPIHTATTTISTNKALYQL